MAIAQVSVGSPVRPRATIPFASYLTDNRPGSPDDRDDVREMRTPLHWIALLIVSLAAAPLAAEAALRLYVSYAAKPARLFRADPQTGWSNNPNLRTSLVNAAGKEWSIQTDENGQRIIANNTGGGRRILILGDSLAFGEGVDIDDRFDVRMLSSLPDVNIINTGIMGHGTDQEYVTFQNWKHRLRPGDTVLIVLNESDYYDVLRRRFFGRSKPWVEQSGASSVLHSPAIGFLERWSDRSLVARAAARLIGPPSDELVSEKPELGQAIDIIRFLLGRIQQEMPSGVRVVLAHHGTRGFLRPASGLSSQMFCGYADLCIDLDEVLTEPDHLLPDGHWSTSGHLAVARAILKLLRD